MLKKEVNNLESILKKNESINFIINYFYCVGQLSFKILIVYSLYFAFFCLFSNFYVIIQLLIHNSDIYNRRYEVKRKYCDLHIEKIEVLNI
jgi:hypothetical protein